MTEEFGRRAFMTTLSLAGMALPMGVATAASGPKLRSDAQNNLLLEDPSRRARVRARIMGSTAKETVNIFYRLHIYGFMGDGSLIPLFTLNHLSVNKWKPLPDDKYESTTYECGVYCKFDTDEPLEEWVNPVTHEKRKVWHFYGGPFTVTIGADGIVTKGADIEPVPLHMESIGAWSSSPRQPRWRAPIRYLSRNIPICRLGQFPIGKPCPRPEPARSTHLMKH